MIGAKAQRCKYILYDFLAVNVAWCVFNLVRYATLPVNSFLPSFGRYYSMPDVILGQMLFPLMMLVLYALSGFYNHVFFKSRVDIFVNTYGVSLIGSVIIFFVALFNDSLDDRLKNYELFTIVWLMISTTVLVPRLILSGLLAKKIRLRQLYFNTIIVGTCAKARHLARQLDSKYPQMGLRIVGFASDNDALVGKMLDGVQVYSLESIASEVSRLDISAFIIVRDNEDARETARVINNLFPLGKSIYVTPDVLHFITGRPRTRMISGEVLIDVSRSDIPAGTWNIKRVSDVVISLIAVVLLVPVFAVIAIWVKATSAGPVFYSQERVGLNKKKFNIYKFRTMYLGSETSGPALSSEDDPRITPAGRILRKYRLDELPQFINVIRGDMSLVGPRPEREYYLRQIIERAPYFSLLHQVRPGITSWGMVKYGYATSVDEMIERGQYDLLYVDNVSLIVDMKILFYTIETVITGKGV